MLLSLSPRLTLVSLSIAPVMGVSAMLYGLHARKLSKLLRAVPHPLSGTAGPARASACRWPPPPSSPRDDRVVPGRAESGRAGRRW